MEWDLKTQSKGHGRKFNGPKLSVKNINIITVCHESMELTGFISLVIRFDENEANTQKKHDSDDVCTSSPNLLGYHDLR